MHLASYGDMTVPSVLSFKSIIKSVGQKANNLPQNILLKTAGQQEYAVYRKKTQSNWRRKTTKETSGSQRNKTTKSRHTYNKTCSLSSAQHSTHPTDQKLKRENNKSANVMRRNYVDVKHFITLSSLSWQQQGWMYSLHSVIQMQLSPS